MNRKANDGAARRRWLWQELKKRRLKEAISQIKRRYGTAAIRKGDGNEA